MSSVSDSCAMLAAPGAQTPLSSRQLGVNTDIMQEMPSPVLSPRTVASKDAASDEEDDFILLQPEAGNVQAILTPTASQPGSSPDAPVRAAPLQILEPSVTINPSIPDPSLRSASMTAPPSADNPPYEAAANPPANIADPMPLVVGSEVMLSQALRASANTFCLAAETIAEAAHVKYSTLRACHAEKFYAVCSAVGTAYCAIRSAHRTAFGAIHSAHAAAAATSSAARQTACMQYSASLLTMATAAVTAARAVMMHGGGAARGAVSGAAGSSGCVGRLFCLVGITGSLVMFGGTAGVGLGLVLGAVSAVATVTGCVGMLIISSMAWILATTCLIVGAGSLVLTLPVSLIAASCLCMMLSTLLGVGMALAAIRRVMQVFEAQR